MLAPTGMTNAVWPFAVSDADTGLVLPGRVELNVLGWVTSVALLEELLDELLVCGVALPEHDNPSWVSMLATSAAND